MIYDRSFHTNSFLIRGDKYPIDVSNSVGALHGCTVLFNATPPPVTLTGSLRNDGPVLYRIVLPPCVSYTLPEACAGSALSQMDGGPLVGLLGVAVE